MGLLFSKTINMIPCMSKNMTKKVENTILLEEEKLKVEILKPFRDLGKNFEIGKTIEITKNQKDYFLVRQTQGYVKFI